MIHQLTDKAIGVEIHKDGKSYFIKEDAMGKWVIGYKTIELLPPGEWKILGLGKDLTKEQWSEVVDKFNNGSYRDYEHKVFDPCDEYLPMYLSAPESGLSLLRSKGLQAENTLILIKQ